MYGEFACLLLSLGLFICFTSLSFLFTLFAPLRQMSYDKVAWKIVRVKIWYTVYKETVKI